MRSGSQVRLAGGCLLAASILIGAGAGIFYRQPSIGLLAGLGAGIVLLGLVWLFDFARRK